MKHLFLELDLDNGYALHVYNKERQIVAVVENVVTVSRFDGWVCIVHGFMDGSAETYIPADEFSHFTVIYPRPVADNDE